MLCRAKPPLNTNTALTSLERPHISQSRTENELSPDHKESSWYTFTFSSWLRQNHGNSVLICNFLAAMSALLNIIPGLTGPNRVELRLLTVIMSALIISNKLWLIPQRQPLVWLIEYHEMFTKISALAVVVMIPTADTDLAELLYVRDPAVLPLPVSCRLTLSVAAGLYWYLYAISHCLLCRTARCLSSPLSPHLTAGAVRLSRASGATCARTGHTAGLVTGYWEHTTQYMGGGRRREERETLPCN